jgi:ATP-dependent DNA helicase RecQ
MRASPASAPSVSKTLRPFQKQALDALARPGHVLCVSPTGSGKSLIYEQAALKPGRRTLLVTPLVALARQQHQALSSLPEAAVALGAGDLSEGPPKLEGPTRSGIWIVSPEKISHPRQREALLRWRPDFLVVDECHCLWDWGENFRPAFRALPELIGQHAIHSSLWLTATLPTGARNELRSVLPPPLIELGGFDLPPSLEISVARIPWPDRASTLVSWLRHQTRPGIVFTSTRETSRRLERLLHAAGIPSLAYHAGLSQEERRAAEAGVSRGEVRAVVATSAFGMGMNYPMLEWAVLWQAPASLLSLAQAIGRVGRDPLRPARALVFWDQEDFRLNAWVVGRSEKRRQQLLEVKQFLEGTECRRETLRSAFEESYQPGPPCQKCDFCRKNHA